MNKRNILKTIIGITLIALAGGYLLWQGFSSSWAYYYSVDEYVSSKVFQTGAGGGRMIRIAGVVKKDSLVTNEEKMQLKFELAGQKSVLPVEYKGIVPKNFEGGKEVVVEGVLGNNGIFKAEQILTRCESKYEARLKTTKQEKTGY